MTTRPAPDFQVNPIYKKGSSFAAFFIALLQFWLARIGADFNPLVKTPC
jgi:hypothetical protein